MARLLRSSVLRATVIVGTLVLYAGCDDPVEPTLLRLNVDGYPPALPDHTFLDDRLAVCPTPAEIASVSEVEIFFDPTTAGPLVCRASDGSVDLSQPQELVYHALLLMKALRFERPLPWTDQDLYGWWRSIVRRAAFVGASGTSNCCGDGATITIYLGISYALNWEHINSLIGGLVHEARHIDGPPHTCGVRDNLVSDLGAFGAHNLYFTWMGTYSDPAVVPVEYRPYELWTACSQRNNAFCLEPRTSCREIR